MDYTTWFNAFASEIDEVPGRWKLIVDENLLKNDNAKYFTQKTFGSFCCFRCKRRWHSSKTFILFRMQSGNVAMRIFKQGCKKCGLSIMQEPTIVEENIQIVISNVVSHIQKVFYGEAYMNDDRPANNFSKLDGPHDEEHCEACQYGLCDAQTLSSPQSSSSSGISTGLAVGLGLGVGALAALAALAIFSDSKPKENKRGGHQH